MNHQPVIWENKSKPLYAQYFFSASRVSFDLHSVLSKGRSVREVKRVTAEYYQSSILLPEMQLQWFTNNFFGFWHCHYLMVSDCQIREKEKAAISPAAQRGSIQGAPYGGIVPTALPLLIALLFSKGFHST